MSELDITDTITPNSEQVNAEDLLTGPRTVTITGVERGTNDQPVFIHLAEFPGRTYRPAKSMRRVLAACWGTEAAAWVGRRLTIYRDPAVKFGGQEVGGIRISALSDIPGEQSITLAVSRVKRAPFVVRPLSGGAEVHLAALSAATTLEELQAAWKSAAKAGVTGSAEVIAVKDVRKAELTEAPEEDAQ